MADEKQVSKTVCQKLKLLVPLDGSKMAESTLGAVELLGSRCQVEALLLHVIEREAPKLVHGEHHITGEKEAEGYLCSIKERLRKNGVACNSHVHSNKVGDVSLSIIEHAAEYSPDWIMLCTHGSSGIRETLFGSIAQEVLAHGNAPVFLVPPSITNASYLNKIEKIVVPFDVDHSQETVLAQARFLAQAFKAEVSLVSVLQGAENLSYDKAMFRRFMPNAMEMVMDENEQSVISCLDAAVRGSELLDIDAKRVVLRGDVVEEITEFVKSMDADLVIMSTHARHGICAVFEDSKALEVVKYASRPLLLVRLKS